jgi:hypothetical protein
VSIPWHDAAAFLVEWSYALNSACECAAVGRPAAQNAGRRLSHGEELLEDSTIDRAASGPQLGYAIACVHNPERDASDLVIVAAPDFTGMPVARVHLPARVSLGFRTAVGWPTHDGVPADVDRPGSRSPLQPCTPCWSEDNPACKTILARRVWCPTCLRISRHRQEKGSL